MPVGDVTQSVCDKDSFFFSTDANNAKELIFVYWRLDGHIWVSGIHVIYDEPCVMMKSLFLVFYGPNLHHKSETFKIIERARSVFYTPLPCTH